MSLFLRLPRFARQFLVLPPVERGLAVRALALLWLVRLALWALPFGLARRLVFAGAIPHSEPLLAARKVSTALRIASLFVPRATCLPQAITARMLLARYRLPASLHIGVTRWPSPDDPSGHRFIAHAWVESGGEVVAGGRGDLYRFERLPLENRGNDARLDHARFV
jgi:hypothetical protein